jgi:hypothetical protein
MNILYIICDLVFKTFYTLLISYIQSTHHTNLNLFHFITVKILSNAYKSIEKMSLLLDSKEDVCGSP